MCILRGDVEGFLCHFGLKCSSWCTINAGTSLRSAATSIGNSDYESVCQANQMASRSFGFKISVNILKL